MSAIQEILFCFSKISKSNTALALHLPMSRTLARSCPKHTSASSMPLLPVEPAHSAASVLPVVAAAVGM